MEERNVPQLRFPEFEGEWIRKRIDKIAPLQRGFDLPTSKVEKGEFPVVYSNGISRTHINYKAKAPGVVTGRSGTIGSITFVTEAYWPHNTSLWVTDFFNNEAKFVYYFYHTLNLERYGTGSGVPTLNRNDVHSLKKCIPEKPEQQKIASFLSAVDKKIEQLTRKKELLEKYKKGVMQKLFPKPGEQHPELRFKDENGEDFPDWEVFRGEKLFDSHSNKNHDGDLPILAATQDQGMVTREDAGIEVSTSQKSILSYKIVEPGDFVISLRSFQGGIEYSEIKGICSPAYIILKPKRDINEAFFKFYFKKEGFIERLSKTVVGIRDGKQISYTAFGGLKINVPSVEEQNRISIFLNSLLRKANETEYYLNKTKEFKKGLLQQMFV